MEFLPFWQLQVKGQEWTRVGNQGLENLPPRMESPILHDASEDFLVTRTTRQLSSGIQRAQPVVNFSIKTSKEAQPRAVPFCPDWSKSTWPIAYIHQDRRLQKLFFPSSTRTRAGSLVWSVLEFSSPIRQRAGIGSSFQIGRQLT